MSFTLHGERGTMQELKGVGLKNAEQVLQVPDDEYL